MSWGVSKRLREILGLLDDPMEDVESGNHHYESQPKEVNPEHEDAMDHFRSTMVPEKYTPVGEPRMNEQGEIVNPPLVADFDKGQANEILADAIVTIDNNRLKKIQELEDPRNVMNLVRKQRELDKMNALNPVDYVRQNFRTTIDSAKQSQHGQKLQEVGTRLYPVYDTKQEENEAKALKFWDERLNKMPSVDSARKYLQQRKESRTQDAGTA